MNDEIQELKEKIQEAEEEIRNIKNDIDDKVQSFKSKLYEEHSEKMKELRNSIYECQQKIDEIKSSKTHPLEGKVVKRVEERKFGYRSANVTVYGTVEVRRKDTVFPVGTGHHKYPDMGQAFVRLHTRKGVGVRFAHLTLSGYNKWEVVEEKDDGNA